MGEAQIQTVVECYETQIHALQWKELSLQNESSSKKVLYFISFIYFPSDCPQSEECPPLIDFPKSTCSSNCPQSDVTPELIFPNQLFL